MKEAIKKEWVKRLRSGKYTQSESFLRTTEGYCCLGVLCDIYEEEQESTKWKEYGGEYYLHGEFETLPDEVQKWAELDSESPKVNMPNGNKKVLALLNDSGVPFSAIADYIEADTSL